MATCKAYQCRFPDTHTTPGHRCGHCGDYGHGVREHDSHIYLNSLMRRDDDADADADALPENEQCDLEGCKHKTSHNRDAHHCHSCSLRGHTSQNCIIQEYDPVFDNSRFPNLEQELRLVNDIFYTSSRAAIIRKKDNVISILYTNNNNIFPAHIYMNVENQFIYGLTQIREAVSFPISSAVPIVAAVPIAALIPDVSIACPLCRTENSRGEIRSIKGSSDKCSVCLDNEVAVYFVACEHACVCRECLVQL